MEEIKVTKLINGPEAFTPDNEFCLGETEVGGFFVCAGFCAHGLAGAGGIGKVMAEWIVDGEPSLDLWEMDIRRFGAAVPLARLHPRADHARTTRPTTTSATPTTSAAPGGRCDSPPPTPGTASTAPPSARNRAGSGSTGTSPTPPRARSRCGRGAGPGEHWSAAIGAEHRATRERGRDLRRDLLRQARDRGRRRGRASSKASATTASPAAVGQITYTQMLNRRGGIECDFTVARLGEERFSIVTGTAFGNHDRELDAAPPAARGQRADPRRHLALGLLRDLGTAGARGARRR